MTYHKELSKTKNPSYYYGEKESIVYNATCAIMLIGLIIVFTSMILSQDIHETIEAPGKALDSSILNYPTGKLRA